MKRTSFILLLCCLLGSLSAQITKRDLGSDWQFRKADDKEWLRATVPGTVHTDLLNNKKIKDPFYRTNEKDLQWIGTTDWEYKTSFVADDKLLANTNIDLVFEGLDTYADVYLNGTKILVSDNMFLSWKQAVKKFLKKGNNELRIYFYSPISKVMPDYKSLGYPVPVSNNDQADERVSVFTRKAGYHFGWDWGPRLVTSGVWRPVYLLAWNTAKIEDLFIKQKTLTQNNASLVAELEIQSTTTGQKTIDILLDKDSKPLISKSVFLSPGLNKINIPFELPNPELWWPRGLGKQKLYSFTAQIADGDATVSKTVRRGMRNIEVVQESHDKGRSFYFKVNGVPVFMKGANYIPQDNFLTRVTPEKYNHLIETAINSNMNMLRVWGGGIYENDIFYNLCDEKGLLVWQDFMFACALYPPSFDLKKNIYAEAVENVKRLRNHPSIAMWCGNNEIVQFMNENYWGQTKAKWRTPADSAAVFNTYAEIFHNILPSAIKAYDDEKFYWSSSPNGDNYSMKFTAGTVRGDLHYWGVWHGKKPFTEFNKVIPSFMSEYGFQSFPEIESVKKFALPQDYSIDSEVMKSHQRSTIGNGTIVHYMKEMYNVPQNFADFLYVGQVLQGEGIKAAIEAQRRAMPYCMGSLYWQINDTWPAASWSSMDYYGRWKALQYMVKKAYSDVLVSTVKDGDEIKVYAVSDRLSDFNALLKVQVIDFNGKVISESSKSLSIPKNSSSVLFTANETALLTGVDKRKVLLKATVTADNMQLSESLYYFDLQKNLVLEKPQINYVLNSSGNSHTLVFTANKLAKNLKVSVGEESIVFSDNYFDLLPGEKKSVTFTLNKKVSKNQIKVFSLADAK